MTIFFSLAQKRPNRKYIINPLNYRGVQQDQKFPYRSSTLARFLNGLDTAAPLSENGQDHFRGVADMEILIVEDTAAVRDKLVLLLEGQYGYNVVAAVASAEEALNYLAFHPVGLVILDLGLPGISDSKAITALKAVCPEVRILVFSASEEEKKVFSALKAGAIGYLLKSASPQQIIQALEEIRAGGSPMSPTIAMKLLQDYRRQPDQEEGPGCVSPLSGRETEILALLYRGDELAQIAGSLCISLHTVRVHTKKIYTKLKVNSRSHAIYQALQMNLIKS